VYPALTIPVVCAGLVWLAMVRATRYVGISSCVAAATLVLFVWVWHGLGLWVRLTGEEDVPGSDAIAPFLIGTGLLAGVVVFKHRGNLARMARGEEPKVGRPK
jgi:glycerol-3-phosphate acyltransferase PlsY